MYEALIENNDPRRFGDVQSNVVTENLELSLKLLFAECGGYSFRNGLYRVHHPDSIRHWTVLISEYFVNFKGRIVPFGYDWMGRQFAYDLHEPHYLLMFDPATMEDFEIHESLEEFHNNDLVHDREILSENLFNELLKSLGVSGIGYSDCLGHKRPLFLGGSDTKDNYEVINVEVHWEFHCQIYLQIKDLPPGTKINKINFRSST